MIDDVPHGTDNQLVHTAAVTATPNAATHDHDNDDM
jgi:hypothetical protein